MWGIILFVVLGILLLLGLVVLLMAVGIYNGLIRLKNNIDKAWSNIDVLLKQRSSELPKLVDTCKGYMKYEQETFKLITDARAFYNKAQTVAEKAQADTMITGALKTLFAVAENYPDLKANNNFMQLQARISGLENEIADRREFYNDSVNTFNIKIQQFPDLIVAGWMGLTTPRDLFKATEEEKKDVKIDFG